MSTRTLLAQLVRRNDWLNRKVYGTGWGVKIPLATVWTNFVFRVLFFRNWNCKHSVHFTSTVALPHLLAIEEGDAGPFVSLAVSGGCYIQCGNGVSIGAGTIWAPNVAIISANHDPTVVSKEWKRSARVVIGRNCWIGTGAVILPGVLLGDHVVVAAGAVVSKSFPDGYVVLAGVPATAIRTIPKSGIQGEAPPVNQ